MKIGMVCPYSFDVPGGVQFHVRDLAEHFIAAGPPRRRCSHRRTRTPRCRPTSSPAGRAVPVPLQRLGRPAGLRSGDRGARQPLGRAGRFDVLHVHEPVTPSVVDARAAGRPTAPGGGHLPLQQPRAPGRCRRHTRLLRPSLEKIIGRIAVSEDARRTVTAHLGGDAVVIPNGVNVDAVRPRRRRAPAGPARRTRRRSAFLGPDRRAAQGPARPGCRDAGHPRARPGTRLLVAGPGRRRGGARTRSTRPPARRRRSSSAW